MRANKKIKVKIELTSNIGIPAMYPRAADPPANAGWPY